jgi:hypothetical protein
MDIKERISARDRELFNKKMAADEFKVSDEEMSAVDDMFSFAPSPMEKKPAFQEIPDLKPAEIESEMGLDSDFEITPPPGPSKVRMPHVDTQPEVDVDEEEELESELVVDHGAVEFDDFYQPPSPFNDKSGARVSSIQDELSFQPPVGPVEFEEPGEMGVPEVDIPDYNSFGNGNELELDSGAPVMEYEIPAPTPRTTRPAPPPPTRPTAVTPPTAPKQTVRPTIPTQPTPPPPIMPKTPMTPVTRPQEAPQPPKQAARPTPPPPPPPPHKPPAPPTQSTQPTRPGLADLGKPGIENELVLGKVEDKLAAAVKEMLWEIMPPLAEKIIKEEIEKIKTDVSKSFK